jgi:hypothetical protein
LNSAAPANAVGALTHSKPLSVGGNNVRAVNFRFDPALSVALAQRRTTPARQTTTPTNEITAAKTATANTNHFRELIERVIFDCAPNYKPQRIASEESFVSTRTPQLPLEDNGAYSGARPSRRITGANFELPVSVVNTGCAAMFRASPVVHGLKRGMEKCGEIV